MPEEPIIVTVVGADGSETEAVFPAGTTPAQMKSALMNIRANRQKQKDDPESWAQALTKRSIPVLGESLSKALGTYVDLNVGALKGAGQTIVGGARLIQKIPGVTAATDALTGLQPGGSARSMDIVEQEFLTPTNTTQRVGKTGEQIAEAIAPGGLIKKAATKAVTVAAPRLAPFLGQRAARLAPEMVTEAVTGGLHSALQGGDPTIGAVVSGVMPGVAQGTRAARNALLGGTRNPQVVQEAVEFGMRQGVPIDAATGTGRPYVARLQQASGDSIFGAGIAERFKDRQTDALRRVAGDLSDTAHPTAVSPHMAGKGVTDTLEGTIAAEHKLAGQHYGTLRTIEADPTNLKTVQVGTETLPDGTVRAVMADVALPVDMRPVKAALKPVLEEIERTWPLAQKDASPGLVALRNLVSGADAVSASTADANLSVIKRIVREADSPALRTRGQGVAAKAVTELEAAVQQAVAQGGSAATDALRAGRDATIRKYSAAELRDALRDEPVQVFNSLVFRKDAGIERLREVAAQAPGEMAKLGRAWMEQALERPMAEGGFDAPLGLLRKWQDLGPQTKALLFPNPLHRKDLDDFFLLAKKIAENPNPSGTARNLTAINALWSIPAAGLAKLFYSPAGVRELTRAVRTGDTHAVTQALGRVAGRQAAGPK